MNSEINTLGALSSWGFSPGGDRQPPRDGQWRAEVHEEPRRGSEQMEQNFWRKGPLNGVMYDAEGIW